MTAKTMFIVTLLIIPSCFLIWADNFNQALSVMPFDVNGIIRQVSNNQKGKSEIGGEFLVDTNPILLSQPDDQHYPAIAFDGTNYLVVWQDYRSGTDYDVYACRVRSDGCILDPGGIAISTATDFQGYPSVAFGAGNYLVCWQDLRNGTDNNIYAAMLNTDGEISKSSFAITTATNDQNEPAVAFCGTSYLIVWSDDNDISGRRLSLSGTLLGSEITVSNASATQEQPAVVFGDTYYLVVWHDTRTGDDIYATRIDTLGVNRNPSGINISTASNSQSAPDVGFDGNNYLVVWQDNRNGNYDIYASRVDQLGIRLDGSDGFMISNATQDQLAPKVAFDATNYLVVWYDQRSSIDYDIYGARVNIQATVLDPSGFPIFDGGNDQSFPSLVFDGSNYCVTWHDESGADSDVCLTRIDNTAVVIDSSPIVVSIYTNSQTNPSVAFNGTNYLVVWEDGRADDLDILGIRINQFGVILDSTPIVICAEPHDQKYPDIEFDGTHYLVAWQDSRGANTDIFGARVDTSGIVIDTVNIPISTATNRQERPSIAFDGTNYLVCWQDRRSGSGNYNIYFSRIDTSGTVLNPTGIAVCAETQNQQYPDIIFNGTYYMIVWEDYRGGINWDIFGSRIDTSGTILDPSGLAITTALNNQRYPSIAFGINNYLVTWADNRNTDYDIYCCRVDTNGFVLDLDGIAVTNAVENQTLPEIVFDSQNFLLVWEDDRIAGQSEIYCAKVSPTGSLISVMPVIIYDNDQSYPQLVCGLNNQALLVYSGWTGTFNKIPYNNQRIWAKYFSVTAGWAQLIYIPTQKPGKNVKDGGAMVVVDNHEIGSAIYAFRGYKSNEFYKYAGGKWTLMESIPFMTKPPDTIKINKKRVGKGASLCYDGDNTIYATKGNGTYEFWAYDITNNSWRHQKFLTTTKYLKGGTSICYFNGKVYLLAGSQPVYSENFYSYDPLTNTWTQLSKAPITPFYKAWKDGSAIIPLGSTIYALKGRDKYNYFWAYDITTDTWTEKESLPQVHPSLVKKTRVKDGGAITSDGTDLYAIKGGGKQDFWKYTPGAPGVWTPLDVIQKLNNKSVPKNGAALCYYDHIIYLLKGNNTNEFWQYALTTTDGITSSLTNISMLTDRQTSSQLDFTCFPNPCTKLLKINYSAKVAGRISLKLYNVSGSLIKTFIDGYKDIGSYCLHIDNLRIAKGVYFLKCANSTNHAEFKLIVE
jgi:hypothetical protein